MRRVFCQAAALAALLFMVGMSQQGSAQEKAKTRTLKVKLNYTGSGTVDDKHRIFVFLFDSPDFTQGNVMPFGEKDGAAKDAVVTFSDLDRSPVYVSCVYDVAGGYDGQSGPPPSGSPLGMYTTEPPQPTAIKIEEGKSGEIELAFGDDFKMP
jgi:hypothetical protein